MIEKMEDLIELQREQFIQLGEKDFHKDILINVPGCNSYEIDMLSECLVDIPSSYINILRQVDINGTIMGMFSISPFSGRKKSIAHKLLEIHKDPFFPKEFMQKHKMYQIGSLNTDILCVTEGTDQFDEGEILLIEEGDDIYNPEDSQIHRLARDFEQFLIIAGNLEQIHSEMQDKSEEEQRQEFLKRCKILKVDEKYLSSWLEVS